MRSALVVLATLAVASPASAEHVGVVVTGEATLQPQVAAQLEGWLHDRGRTVVPGAHNFSSSGSISVRGVNCPNPMTIDSTIVSGNAASLNCTFQYSLLSGDPKFKATGATSPLAADYYRISAASDAVDRADNATTMTVDIDGQLREGARDIGADEFQ